MVIYLWGWVVAFWHLGAAQRQAGGRLVRTLLGMSSRQGHLSLPIVVSGQSPGVPSEGLHTVGLRALQRTAPVPHFERCVVRPSVPAVKGT